MKELNHNPSMSDETDKLFAALSAAQGKIRDQHKDRSGYQNRYSYADLRSVLVDSRPVLSEHGLAVIQSPSMTDAGNVAIWTMIVHSSGQWIKLGSVEMLVEPMKGLSQSQAVGSVITYARRYTLQAALGISSTDDETDAAPAVDGGADDRHPSQIIADIREKGALIDAFKKQEYGTAVAAECKAKADTLKQRPEKISEFTRDQLLGIEKRLDIFIREKEI